jgi:p-aminobenzoyl-glutamate transporter AbgT
VKFNNYVALYGFTRAISFVFCAFGWILLIKIIADRIKPNESENWHIYAFIASSLLSYFFYLAFVKFYRRYTLEGFMCLTIDPDLQQASEEAKKQASEQQDIEPQDSKAKQLTSLMSN